MGNEKSEIRNVEMKKCEALGLAVDFRARGLLTLAGSLHRRGLTQWISASWSLQSIFVENVCRSCFVRPRRLLTDLSFRVRLSLLTVRCC